jgi:hypothetical protein
VRGPANILIVGEPTDPHVAAVVGDLDPAHTVVVDAESLPRRTYLLTETGLELSDGQGSFCSGDSRGWVRRLAPADWGHGHPIGSHPAVAQAAALSLIAGIARVPGIEWLTPIDPLLIAESKLVQIQAATDLGIRAPRTVVTSSRELAERELGSRIVIKPLGPGHFTTPDDTAAVVYATPVDLRDPDFADLGPTPFLLQEQIHARTHLRAVTVGEHCWVAELSADGLPLDWRAEASAHDSFRASRETAVGVTHAAPALARKLGLGYSSQDWIVTPDNEEVLLDVNPAGQWLFLPEPIGSEVSGAIASWLRGG